MKVLIAEDNEMMQKVLQIKLKRDGHHVISSNDGEDAIEKFNSEKPDIVMTDLMMPGKSGFDLIEYIRKIINSEIPIIVLSVIGQENKVMKAFSLGADDFLMKPFSMTELTLRLNRILEKKYPKVSQ